MKSTRKIITALVFACALIVPVGTMAGGLESFLKEINVKASADLGFFKADLSVTFGVSKPKIDGLFELMASPGDVYMVLRIGEVANQPLERVVAELKKNKGQGWGVIAKNLGIRPGSKEFHALKKSRPASHFRGKSSGKHGKGKS